MSKVTVFNNPYQNTESWSAQGAVVQWGTSITASQALPIMMLGVTINYGRRTSPFFPINRDSSGNCVRVNIAGAPAGTLAVQSIYSPTHTGLESFIEAVTKECKTTGDAVTVTLRPFGDMTCSNSTAIGQTLYLKGVELDTLGLTIQGGDAAIVQMPLNFSFTGLDWEF